MLLNVSLGPMASIIGHHAFQVQVPLNDWRRLRLASARLDTPIGALVRSAIHERLAQLAQLDRNEAREQIKRDPDDKG